MEALAGGEAQESKKVPSRRSGLRLKICSVPLEHHRKDPKCGVLARGRGPFLLERGHLFVAGGAEPHEVPPADLGENPRRQLAACDSTQSSRVIWMSDTFPPW